MKSVFSTFFDLLKPLEYSDSSEINYFTACIFQIATVTTIIPLFAVFVISVVDYKIAFRHLNSFFFSMRIPLLLV